MDKLVKLSRSTIPSFIEFYKTAGFAKHSAATATLKNLLIQAQAHPDYDDKIELLALNGEWKNDGLFMIKTKELHYFNSLEAAPFDRIRKALRLIDYETEVVFPSINNKFKVLIDEIVEEKILEVTMNLKTIGFAAEKSFVEGLPTPS